MRRIVLPALVLLALLLTWLLWWSGEDRGVGPAEEVARGGHGEERLELPPPPSMTSEEAEPSAPSLAGTGTDAPSPAESLHADLQCRVLDDDRTPRPRSVVRLAREELVDPPEYMPTVPGFEGVKLLHYENVRSGSTDGSGIITFYDVPPGRYRVTALAPMGRLAPQTMVDLDATDREVELLYRRAVNARIEVVDPGGRPVEGAAVSLWQGPAQRGTRTDAQGVAVLEDLDPLWDTGLWIRPPREFDLFETKQAWDVRDTRIVLERSHTLTVRVVDEEGKPVAKARVSSRVGQSSGGRIHTADEDGRCRIRSLRAGEERTIRAGPPGSWAGLQTEPVTARAGAEELVVVLPRGGSLDVVVLDWPDDAQGTLHLTAAGSEAAHLVLKIGTDGRCTFRHLDPAGVYVLWGTLKGDGRFVYVPETRPQEEPLEVALQEGESIEVHLEVPDGVEVRALSAWGPGVRRRAGPFSMFPAGTYEIPPLPPGRWTVQAYGFSIVSEGLATRPPEWNAEAVAQAGGTVRLVMERVPDADR